MTAQPIPGIDEIITHIYQGSLETKPWQSFLRCLRLRTNADVAAMMLRPAKQGLASLTLWDCRVPPTPEQIKGAAMEHAALGYLDPLTSTLSRTGGIFTIDQVVPRQQLIQTDFYNRLMQPYGIEHIVAMHFPEPNGASCFVGLLNGPDKKNFGDAEKQLLLALRQHLEHALKVHTLLKRNELEKEIYGEALNRLTIGTIILDGRGRVLEINRTARSILQRNSCISLNDNHLLVAKPRYREELNRLINSAINWREKQLPDTFVEALRIECPTGADIGLLVRAAPASGWYQNEGVPSVIIHLEDFEQDQRAPEQIVARLFGLTKSEARLAAMLASGLTLTDAAVKLNLTESSVRTYSKKIFAKMGVGRQAELVRLIMKSVALLARPVQAQSS